MEWLNRSLIGESLRPMDFDLLREKLFREWYYLTNVKAKGSYKCLLTFETNEDVEAALSDGRDLLLNHFDEVKQWSDMELCQTRHVWLDCVGVPPHG